MKTIYRNYVIDMVILVTGALSGITGIVKWPGLVYTLGLSYQDLPMDPITLVHDWTGLIMCAFAFLRVLLHMKWLTAMTKKFLGLNGGNREKA
jgi:hypothetical protein